MSYQYQDTQNAQTQWISNHLHLHISSIVPSPEIRPPPPPLSNRHLVSSTSSPMFPSPRAHTSPRPQLPSTTTIPDDHAALLWFRVQSPGVVEAAKSGKCADPTAPHRTPGAPPAPDDSRPCPAAGEAVTSPSEREGGCVKEPHRVLC